MKDAEYLNKLSWFRCVKANSKPVLRTFPAFCIGASTPIKSGIGNFNRIACVFFRKKSPVKDSFPPQKSASIPTSIWSVFSQVIAELAITSLIEIPENKVLPKL